MAVILDEAGTPVYDEASAGLFDETGSETVGTLTALDAPYGTLTASSAPGAAQVPGIDDEAGGVILDEGGAAIGDESGS